MRMEMHAHCSGASVCADVLDQQFVADMKKNGIEAFLLVNHVNLGFKRYPGETYKEKIDYYFSRFEEIKQLAKENGIKAFLGAEVVTLTDDGMHQEFIIVGFDKDFLYNNDLVNKVNQEQLFEIANKNGLFMYQTHPFRTGEKTGNPKFMHGAEGLNGHYHHDNNNEKALKFCEDNSLKIIAGNDYHHHNQPLVGWSIIPDDISNERQLADYLLNNQAQICFDQEKCLFERQKYIEEERIAQQ